jgi:hypothetical protein
METDTDTVVRWVLERIRDAVPGLSPTGRLAMCGLALTEPDQWVPLGDLVPVTGRTPRTIRHHLAPAVAAGYVLADGDRYRLNAALFRTVA